MDDYVERSWLPAYRRHDPRDLLAMLDTWLANDLGAAALGRITARTMVIAGSHDLYFPPTTAPLKPPASPAPALSGWSRCWGTGPAIPAMHRMSRP